MSFTLKYNNGTIFDPINFRNASNLTAENIVTYMEEKAEEMQVPMQLSIDTVKEGGLLGKKYPCVVIKHPNPPQEYFTNVIVINGSTVNFFFFGNSKANYVTNRAKQREGTILGGILNAVSGSDEMAWQQEKYGMSKFMKSLWHVLKAKNLALK